MIEISLDSLISGSRIYIAGSKSIANRLLILQALSLGRINLSNLPDCDDTQILKNILSNLNENINVGHAGTCMRFLTAYLAIQNSKYNISGSERMHQRPIKVLVDSLKSLGASINYKGYEGFPPLEVCGKKLTGGIVSIDGGVSSQYISALLLIAPFLKNGIELKIKGSPVSFSYIELTLDILSRIGANVKFHNNTIFVSQLSLIKKCDIKIEGDWSSASYWYSLIALSPISSCLELSGLNIDSYQGDREIARIMEFFGVKTISTPGGVIIKKESINKKHLKLDFTNCPDIAQTIMACGCALNMQIEFIGVETLRIKETDRIKAMNNELKKFNCGIEKYNDLYRTVGDFKKTKGVIIETYNDHRMAMSFAPLSKLMPIVIKDDLVVSKSYPNFWNDFSSLGLKIEKI